MKLLIILTLILLILIYLNGGGIEHYDIVKRNYNLNSCAETCKLDAGCYGFAYNTNTGSCYLSQDVITGKPVDAPFKDEYSANNTTCNKFQPITVPEKNPTLDERKGNSIYTCSESSTQFPQFYIHNNGKFTNLGEGKNLDEIFNVDVYSTVAVQWPKRYDPTGELALLNNTTQKYNINSVSNVEQILLNENTLTKPPVPDPPSTTNNKVQNDLTNFFNKATTGLSIPYQKRSIPNSNLQQVYQQHDELNTGKYLKPYQCLRNITNEECLKYCTTDLSCVGVEWNPNYKNNRNVCCPYKTIGNYVKRAGVDGNGKFYEKHNQYTRDNKNIYISVL